MNKSQPTIRLATKNDEQIWDDYVLKHPKGIAYQLYAWKAAVENAYGFKCCFTAGIFKDCRANTYRNNLAVCSEDINMFIDYLRSGFKCAF